MAAGALAVMSIGASDDLADTLRAVAATYYLRAGEVATATGRDATMDYYERLRDDAGLLRQAAPAGYPPELWRQTVRAESVLDLSLATQLLNRSYQPMESIRGLGESFVRSTKDGTMQPVALYVPTGYSPQRPPALVVFLHGWPQAESHLIAPQYLCDLAERSNTIIVAPYGRGFYDFNGSASDVYDALDAATRAFGVDSGKRYLAGYSMGGFSVYNIAPMHPRRWAAVMSVAGSLIASRAPGVAGSMQHARFYVLTGALDTIVPTLYPTSTAIYLRDAGLEVTFYSAPDGTHSMYSLRAILARAWSEMERGIVRLPTGLTGAGNLPEAVTE